MKIIILLLLTTKVYLFSQQSIYLTTEDGWKIHLKYMKPKKENFPLLLLIHSQKENYTEWKNWFSHIEAFGYGWAAIDLRGHGVSIYKTDGSSQTYSSFSVSGNDNEYNKMIRDIETAVIYLSSSGVAEDKIFIIGSHLGANVAAKFCVINKNIAGLILIHPYSTINDIPIIGLLRNYGKRPILMVSPQNNLKRIRDTLLLYHLTRSKTDPKKTFIIISGNFTTPKDMPKSLIYRILHWINTPYLPEVVTTNEIQTNISTSQIQNLSSPIILILEDE
ncbi:MAG: alpha/beta hydrolase [Elusimicrobiales bacterium]|nr:alpha/beta hydrolase [Elusimicrobiales bacterium]